MHCHCGTNNRAPRWTFTDPCKPEARPGAREESASPAWLAAPAMNARDITNVYIRRLHTECDRHYIGSVTATTHQEKRKKKLATSYPVSKVLGYQTLLSVISYDFYDSTFLHRNRSKMLIGWKGVNNSEK